MNPEYKRQIVKKLLWLSEWMIAELDSNSPHYWNNHMQFIFGRVDAINDHLRKAKNRKAAETFGTELWVDPWLSRQHNIANLMESDPFLPKILRKKIADFYGNRVADMSVIYAKIMTQFALDEILTRDRKRTNKKVNCWTKLNDAYYEKGWGWESSHNRIIKFRQDIELYLTKLK